MFLSVNLLIAFVLFAFVTSVTPGPNNTMLLASGINFGFYRSVPHILGISSGFFVMVLGVGLGLESVFSTYPILYTVLRYVGAVYLLYLAWKIATSKPMDNTTETRSKPLSFLAAAAFQWVNPKCWVMAIGALSTYLPQHNHVTSWKLTVVNVTIIALIFALINAPSVGVWAMFGSLLRKYLQDPKWMRIANIIMALLLVISLYPILVDTN